MRPLQYAFIFLLTSFTFCSGEEKSLSELKLIFQEADKELNVSYKEALKKITGEDKEAFKENQRNWIEYRDYISEWQVEDGVKKEDSPYYWELMGGLSQDQVKMIKAWSGVSQEDEWSGTYSDGYGGHLTIKRKGKKLHFQISVVRGPTFHIGELEGEAKLNQYSARFSTPIEHEPGEEAWLTFIKEGEFRIKVVGENTQGFHGARAFFDGTYLRLATR